MKAETLNQKIDKLAEQKAEAHVERIYEACRALTQKLGKSNSPDDGRTRRTTWFSQTIIEILTLYVDEVKAGVSQMRRPRSQELVDYYKSAIMEELLEKIPMIEELCGLPRPEPEPEDF